MKTKYELKKYIIIAFYCFFVYIWDIVSSMSLTEKLLLFILVHILYNNLDKE